MSRVETHDLACLIVQAEGADSVRDALLYALYVLHRMHLTWVGVAREAEADREWGDAVRLHAA